ncbi:MAG: hypothetical protein ACRC1G_22500 [Bradyrhizobium sp.]|nr:hypothetical protein [Bradyrhizobium sp.]
MSCAARSRRRRGCRRIAIDGHFPRWGVAAADSDRIAAGVLDLFISRHRAP